MASTTDNFNIPLYDTGEPANLRDQYNNAMDIIDDELKRSADSVTAADGTATDAKSTAEAAQALAIANKNDIAEINANLNALHANSATDAKNLYERIAKNDYVTHNVLVAIGDSQSAGHGIDNPASNRWTKLLANRYGMTEKSYAYDGTGFTQGGTYSFPSQLSTAIDDGSFDNSNVGIIIIEGGVNDPSDVGIYDALTGMLTSIQRNFPNAKTIILPIVMGNRWHEANAAGKSNNLIPIMQAYYRGNWRDTVLFDDVFSWFESNTGFIQEDGLHLSLEGNRYLAARVYSELNGGSFTGFAIPNGIVDLSSFVKPTATETLNGTQTLTLNKVAPTLYVINGFVSLTIASGSSFINKNAFTFTITLDGTEVGTYKPFFKNSYGRVPCLCLISRDGTSYPTSAALIPKATNDGAGVTLAAVCDPNNKIQEGDTLNFYMPGAVVATVGQK